MEAKVYAARYYQTVLDKPATSSSSVIVPFLVEQLRPKSLLDLGAGTGIWSRAALDAGITDVVAVDGEWVAEHRIHIPREKFVFHSLDRPLQLGRRFDLALSLEVGEHLSADSADTLVASLTAHSNIILFGAAMPFQGGVGHVNEQWPSYWQRKFFDRGYAVLDIIRPVFWNDPQVEYFYKQNVFLYVGPEVPSPMKNKLVELVHTSYSGAHELTFIHPRKYVQLSFENVSIRQIVKKGSKLAVQRLSAKLRNMVGF